MRSLVLLALCLAACAGSDSSSALDKKTDWLGSCEQSEECRPGLECVTGLCTTRCGDRNACSQYAQDAICAPVVAAANECGAAPTLTERACTLGCEQRSQCASRNDALLCIANACVADPCANDGAQDGGDLDGAATGDDAVLEGGGDAAPVNDSGDTLETPDASMDGSAPVSDAGDAGDTQDVCAQNVCVAAYPCQALATGGYSCRGQLVDWRAMDSPDTFVDRGDGTVVDTRNELVWQRTVDLTERSLADAQAYCASLELPGLGWRVPAITELESIIDFQKAPIRIDLNVFPNTPEDLFWSASPLSAPVNHDPWAVNFNSGLSWTGVGSGMAYVRCVRSDAVVSTTFGAGGTPPGRYTVSDGTIHDAYTGLTWQQTIDATEYTQEQAITHCTGLAIAGGGWRLPAISELLTIADRTKFNPSVDPEIFAGPAEPATSDSIWSSTIGAVGEPWGLNQFDGTRFNGGAASTPLKARCVR